MARGDSTNTLASVADLGTLTRQPASGVEELVVMASIPAGEGTAPNETPAIQLSLTDGTTSAIFLNGDAGKMAAIWFRGKYISTNSLHIRVTNVSGGTGNVLLSVVEVG